MYVVLIGAAVTLAEANVIYTIICFIVFWKSEDFIKGLFGVKPQLGSPLTNMMKFAAVKSVAKGAKNLVKKGVHNSAERTKDRFKTYKNTTKEQMDLARNEDGTFDKGARGKALLTASKETARRNLSKRKSIQRARGLATMVGGGRGFDRVLGSDENARSKAAKQFQKLNGRAGTTAEISQYLRDEQMLKDTKAFKDEELDDVHEQYSKGVSLDRLKNAKKTYRTYSKKDFGDPKKVQQMYDALTSGENPLSNAEAIDAIKVAASMHSFQGEPKIPESVLKKANAQDYAKNASTDDKMAMADMHGISLADMDTDANKQKIDNSLEAEYEFINDDSNKQKAKIRLQAKGMDAGDASVQKELQREFRYKNNDSVRQKALDAGIEESQLDDVLSEEYEYLAQNGAGVNVTTNSIDRDSDITKDLEAEFLVSKTDTQNREKVRQELILEGKDTSDSSVEARMREAARKSLKVDDGHGGKHIQEADFTKNLDLAYVREMKKKNPGSTAKDAKDRLDFILEDSPSNNLSRSKLNVRMKELTGKEPTQEEITVEMNRLYDVNQRIDRHMIENQIKATTGKTTVSTREVEKVILDSSVYFDSSIKDNSKATEVMLNIKGIEDKVASNHNRADGIKVASIARQNIKNNQGKSKSELKANKVVQRDILTKQIEGVMGSQYSEHEAKAVAEDTYKILERSAK